MALRRSPPSTPAEWTSGHSSGPMLFAFRSTGSLEPIRVEFFDAELVGYMTLLADAVVLETKERKRLALSAHDHPAVPALKIARLAVRSRTEGGEHPSMRLDIFPTEPPSWAR